MAVPANSSVSPDSMEITPLPPLEVSNISDSETSDQLQYDDAASNPEIDDNSPAEDPPSRDSPPPERHRQLEIIREHLLEGETPGVHRTTSAPPQARLKQSFVLVKQYGSPKYPFNEKYRPLRDLLVREGQIPDHEQYDIQCEALRQFGLMLASEDPNGTSRRSFADERKGRLDYVQQVQSDGGYMRTIDAFNLPGRYDNIEVMLVGTIIPSTFLGLTWENLHRYRRYGGKVRALKMEENHMVIEINGVSIVVKYRHMREETYMQLMDRLDMIKPQPLDDPEEVYNNTHKYDKPVMAEINEFLVLSQRFRDICEDDDKIQAFQMMFFFLRYWAIRRGLYSSPGRPLHDTKIFRMILKLPRIISFSQGICAFFEYHSKCLPGICTFEFSHAPHYQSEEEASLWNCWSHSLHDEIKKMHTILVRALGLSHICDDTTHDWCTFLNDCTRDVEYNNRDKYRIVISLMYTNNSPEMGTKLLDVMEEQIPILHKFLHSGSLYKDCRVWPQRLVETTQSVTDNPFQCYWVFSAHKADREGGPEASFSNMSEWLLEWNQMMVRKYERKGGSANHVISSIGLFNPGEGPPQLGPDLRIWPRQEVKPPADIAARFESEEEDFFSSEPVSAGEEGSKDQGKGKGKGIQPNRRPRKAAGSSSTDYTSSDSKDPPRDPLITIERGQSNPIDQSKGKGKGKGKQPSRRSKANAGSSSTDNVSDSKNFDIRDSVATREPGPSNQAGLDLEQSMQDISVDSRSPGTEKTQRLRRRTAKKTQGMFSHDHDSVATTSTSDETPPVKKSLMEASKILSRLRTDPSMNPDEYEIGYQDRFKDKLQWKPVNEWETETTEESFIPEWKIEQFKDIKEGLIVWNKKEKVDLLTNKEGYY